MGKKKIIGLCLAVGLMLGVVGGSLAWFTDSDSETNHFSTSGDISNNGIDIVEEDWVEANAQNILPGTTVAKSVQVENKATYSQYMRVKLTKVWKDKAGNKVDKVWVLNDKIVPAGTKDSKEVTLDTNLIKLNFGENIKNEHGKWTDKTIEREGLARGYYYYNGVVDKADEIDGLGSDITNKLLESVTLSKDAGNIYKDLKFDVIVDAEGIQSENGAIEDAWGYTPILK